MMTFNTVVSKVEYSSFHDCTIIRYVDDIDKKEKMAACPAEIIPYVGDKVSIFKNDELNFKGFGAMVVNHERRKI